MPDYIGRIEVPTLAPSGVFPLVPDWGYVQEIAPQVVTHQFGSGNAKIGQSYTLGPPVKRFRVRFGGMTETERASLRDFWEARKSTYQPFTFECPNDDDTGTTAYTVRFEDAALTWEFLCDALSSAGLTLIEVNPAAPTYAVNATQTRFPSGGLPAALLARAQELIPLIKIRVREAAVDDIFLSDRRCTIGGQLYQARLLRHEGIGQDLGGASDQATFTFGNADRVMRDLAADTNLLHATVSFSLFHVGTGIKIDLWSGDVVDWAGETGPEFSLVASDGAYELGLNYPCRKIARECGKAYDNAANGCPYTAEGALDLVHFPSVDALSCDRGLDTPNGCLAHGMKEYFGGVKVNPQGVRIKDNSTGTWGFGRSKLTATSIVGDSTYGEVLQEVYTDAAMPVNCKIAAGREESEFYDGLGIISAGPLTAIDPDPLKHRLDGSPCHGPGSLGLRTVLGSDPAGAGEYFSLGQVGDQTGGDRRKAFNGTSTYEDTFAAGVAFAEIRRNDAKGLQLTRLSEHEMQVVVTGGMGTWYWDTPGDRHWGTSSTNPVWIAVNAYLRARGLFYADAATQEAAFDSAAACAAAPICNDVVDKIVGVGQETQYKFRGVIKEEKPLRDWLQEILNNCLGYFTFSNGKLRIGLKYNSSTIEAFTAGNILVNTLQLAPAKPAFNRLVVNFADEDYEFTANSIAPQDIDHASEIGSASGPVWLEANMNLAGASTKSRAARIGTTRLREELGGITAAERRKARIVAFKTTVLALNVEPGMVCSMTHTDMPGGAGEFRVTSWRLNPDYSIDIQGRTTTDSMYDLTIGPKPADVLPDAVPDERVVSLVPGNVQPIGGDAFLITKVEDGQTATLTITYDPPADMAIFQGVAVHVEAPDGSLRIALTNSYDYNGDSTATAGDRARRGTCEVKMPQPAAAPETWRVYLTSRSRAYRVPLVMHGTTGESPSMTVDISQATGGNPPPLPDSVTISELTRWLKTDNQTPWVRIRVAVTLPSDPVAKEWVSIWFSWDDGLTREGASREYAIGTNPGVFDIDLPVPISNETWKAFVTTSSPAGINSPADAVPSNSLVVAGIGNPSANDATNATLTDLRYGSVGGQSLWGCTLNADISASDPYFWFAYWTRQYVDAGGTPDPARPDEIHGNEFNAPGVTIADAGGLDQPMPSSATYKYVRHRWYVMNRAGVSVLQTNAFGIGVSYLDTELDPGAPPVDQLSGVSVGPIQYATNSNGQRLWGADVAATAPSDATFVRWWWTIQWVDSNGVPDPSYPETNGLSHSVPGATTTDVSDVNWGVPPASYRYRIARYRFYIERIGNSKILQTSVNGGLGYFDLEPTASGITVGGSARFVVETPKGEINGVESVGNTHFTLSFAPSPPKWLDLVLANCPQHVDVDFSISGNEVDYFYPPQVGERHIARYVVGSGEQYAQGNARQFAGGTDMVNFGHDDAFNITGDVSLGIWVKFPSDANDGGTLIQHGVGDSGEVKNHLYDLLVSGASGAWDFKYFHEYGAALIEGPIAWDTNIPNDVWRYIGLSRDATAKTLSLFVGDGSSIALISTQAYTNAPTGGTDATCVLSIGGQPGPGGAPGNGPHKGDIAEQYLWSGRVLTLDEHSAAMQGNASRTGLVFACSPGSNPESDWAGGRSGTVTGTTLVEGHV